MARSIEQKGKTLEAAIAAGLELLGLEREQVDIEVLEAGEPGGLLGIGRKDARVRLTERVSEAMQPTTEAYEYQVVETEEILAEPETESGEAAVEAGAEEILGADVEDLLSLEADPQLAKAMQHIECILQALDVEADVTCTRQDDQIAIEVEGEDVGAVIGRRGETLNAIQYLTSLAVNANEQEHVYVSIDVAG